MILVLSGCWFLVLAGLRRSKPQKYERSSFSTLSVGMLLVALGGAWYLTVLGNILIAIALVLLLIGAIAIAAALRRK